MRLIDADALKNHYRWWKGGTKTYTLDEMVDLFDTIIDVQPTIDPVKHGVWVEVDGRYDRHKCSVCGEPTLTVGGIYDDDEELTDYCPNCGAKMDLHQ